MEDTKAHAVESERRMKDLRSLRFKQKSCAEHAQRAVPQMEAVGRGGGGGIGHTGCTRDDAVRALETERDTAPNWNVALDRTNFLRRA